MDNVTYSGSLPIFSLEVIWIRPLTEAAPHTPHTCHVSQRSSDSDVLDSRDQSVLTAHIFYQTLERKLSQFSSELLLSAALFSL